MGFSFLRSQTVVEESLLVVFSTSLTSSVSELIAFGVVRVMSFLYITYQKKLSFLYIRKLVCICNAVALKSYLTKKT